MLSGTDYIMKSYTHIHIILFFHPQYTEHSWRKTAQRRTLGTTVRKWVENCHGSFCVCALSVQLVLESLYCLSLIVAVLCCCFFFPRERANCRMETADMPLCQRRRRTWQCSGGEGGSAVALLSVIKLHSRWTVWKTVISLSIVLCIYLFWAHQPLYLIPLFAFLHTLCSPSVCRHVMNELLETERAYVEELLCVLQVFICSTEGFIICLLPVPAVSCFVFAHYRDMPLRWIIQQCLTSSLLLCRTKRRFCLATCLKFTTSTRGEEAPSGCHWWCLHCDLTSCRPSNIISILIIYLLSYAFLSFLVHDSVVSRTFLTELEQYTDCPELVGRCFLERVSELWDFQAQRRKSSSNDELS